MWPGAMKRRDRGKENEQNRSRSNSESSRDSKRSKINVVNSVEEREALTTTSMDTGEFFEVHRKGQKRVQNAQPIVNDGASTSASPKQTTQTNTRLPPIVVKSLSLASLRPELQARKLYAEFQLSGIGFFAKNLADHRTIINTLESKKAEFSAHDLKEDRPFKAAIRGLLLMEIDDIVDELKISYKLEVTEVHRIKRRDETNQNYHQQLYLAHFKRGSCSMNKLQAVRTIQSVIIKWESYRGGHKGPTQCLR